MIYHLHIPKTQWLNTLGSTGVCNHRLVAGQLLESGHVAVVIQALQFR
jgi:hypothetical protein